MPRRRKIALTEPGAMADRLAALRATTGLSQQKFAEMVGLGYKQWGNYESGSRIGIDAALVLVQRMHVTLDWIYLGETAMMPAGLLARIEAIQSAAHSESA